MDQSSPSEAPGPSWEMEGSSFINRMSTEDKNSETIPFEPMFLTFKRHKVMISNAIKKPFPFLEVLRDSSLITEKMYEDFKDSCTNLVPVQNVVYRALEELEKKFNENFLPVLFSPVNLSEYPDLEPISENFDNVLPQNELCFEGTDRGDLNSQLSLEQGTASTTPTNEEGQRENPTSPE
uniref:nuclear autoantigen Sp-100-like isoform X2 n=1 Tax=Myodes glareolus TaxID=447135 RepID=UPI0020226503|nr:nuclear autoantigen Sp-100-like isoform X2 [Myodes glareolus]